MRNLIKNSCWRLGEDNRPRYFSSEGVSFRGCLEQFRVGDAGQECGESHVQYDPLIPVTPGECIIWGIMIRAMYADEVMLRAEFYDIHGEVIRVEDRDITCSISNDFQRTEGMYTAPAQAVHVRLSIHLCGMIRWLEMYNPIACSGWGMR